MQVETEYDLGALNTLRLASVARWFVAVESRDDLSAALAFAAARRRRVVVLGGGSNVVLAPRIDAVVVRMANTGIDIRPEDDDTAVVRVGAGESWHGLVESMLERGWHGLENLALIPGSAGAAPVQNIGAYGVELDRFVVAVEAVDLTTGNVRRFDRADCEFGYRDSVFRRRRGDYAITSLSLRLSRSAQPDTGYTALDTELTRRGVDRPTPAQVFAAVVAIRQRRLPDPAAIPNVGSFFKNPIVDAATFAALARREPDLISYLQPDGRHKLAAAQLIELAGLRDWRGDAVALHERHALVLVNHGASDAAVVLEFAERLRAAVTEHFGVVLEREPVAIDRDGGYA